MISEFGSFLNGIRIRKTGLTQMRLAHMMGYDPAVLTRMVAGKKDLTGPSGRSRILLLIALLIEEGVLSSREEADTLLILASQHPLYDGFENERALLHLLDG